MTHQAPRQAMLDQPRRARRAVQTMTTRAADRHRRVAAAIQEQQCLFAAFECARDAVAHLVEGVGRAPDILRPFRGKLRGFAPARHGIGAAGAPKFGDAGAWGARIKQGYDTLVSHAVKGIRAMPAKGGNPDLDDVEVARAVTHMANAAGASFKEPEAKK